MASHTTVIVPFTDTQNDAFYRPHQIIAVSIHKNGSSPIISARFLFDTGSSHCAISASLAAKLGLPVHPMRDQFGRTLTFAGGTAAGITVPQLDIGTFQIKDIPINILPDEKLTHVVGQLVDGILGGDIWHSLAVCIDFTNSQLTFVTPPNPSLYSALTSTSIDFPTSEVMRLGFNKALVVPLLNDAYTSSALFEMRNNAKTETQMLLIDSGTPTTALSEPIAHNLELEPILKGNYTNIQDFSAALSWLPDLHGGDLTLNNSLITYPNQYAQGFVPRLGLDILANYNILLDFPHRKMYLKPRPDLQAVTSRQYEAASPMQRHQWAQKQIMIIYPTLDGSAISYDLSGDGLPIAQARRDWIDQPVPILLKSNTANTFILESLTKQWNLKLSTMLSRDGKPQLLRGQTLHTAKTSSLYLGSAQANGDLVVFPNDMLPLWASYQAVSGVIGSNFLFAHPILMDPQTQTWMPIWKVLQPDDLTSLKMADAAIVAIQDPDADGSVVLPIKVQQGTAEFTEMSTLATGSAFTLLSAQAAQALKLTPEPQKLKYGTGRDLTVFNQAHLSQMVIGNVVLKDVQVAYPDGAMPDGYYPRLGMNVLSKLRLLVDTHAKKLYVKKAGGSAP